MTIYSSSKTTPLFFPKKWFEHVFHKNCLCPNLAHHFCVGQPKHKYSLYGKSFNTSPQWISFIVLLGTGRHLPAHNPIKTKHAFGKKHLVMQPNLKRPCLPTLELLKLWMARVSGVWNSIGRWNPTGTTVFASGSSSLCGNGNIRDWHGPSCHTLQVQMAFSLFFELFIHMHSWAPKNAVCFGGNFCFQIKNFALFPGNLPMWEYKLGYSYFEYFGPTIPHNWMHKFNSHERHMIIVSKQLYCSLAFPHPKKLLNLICNND